MIKALNIMLETVIAKLADLGLDWLIASLPEWIDLFMIY